MQIDDTMGSLLSQAMTDSQQQNTSAGDDQTNTQSPQSAPMQQAVAPSAPIPPIQPNPTVLQSIPNPQPTDAIASQPALPVQPPAQLTPQEKFKQQMDQVEKDKKEKDELYQKLLKAQENEKNNPSFHLTDPQLQQFLSDIERDLLFHIIWNMKHREISLEDASKLAKDFLSALPPTDKKDLLDKLEQLAEHYKEAQEVYAKYLAPLQEEEREKKLAAMRDHIKSGNIEQALQIAKGEV